MSSTFGRVFRVTTFGESHCKGVGTIVDGCPPGMALSESDIQSQLDRRRPGQSSISTKRDEKDRVTIQSGTELGVTLGTPISLFVPNQDQKPSDYSQMSKIPRPSHADYTYQMKYGIRASSGGGRSSARETIGRVCAGAIAEKFLKEQFSVEIVAWVSSVADIDCPKPDVLTISRDEVDKTIIRCPDKKTAATMEELIKKTKDSKDSVGGVVSCVCKNVPVGLGEPVFNKLEAMTVVSRVGFPMASMLFSALPLNHFSTIGKQQHTADFKGKEATLAAKGRHDPCVVARAVPIVESMAAIVLADCVLQQRSRFEVVPFT